MTANDFFQKIQSRYGLSVEMLKSVWEQSRVDNHERHVKRFKLHLEKVAGEAPLGGPEGFTDSLSESIARVFLTMDLAQLEEEVNEYLYGNEYYQE